MTLPLSPTSQFNPTRKHTTVGCGLLQAKCSVYSPKRLKDTHDMVVVVATENDNSNFIVKQTPTTTIKSTNLKFVSTVFKTNALHIIVLVL